MPPTAPNKIASLCWQRAIVASEIASPSASIAVAPTRAWVVLNVWPYRLATVCKTCTACSATSGPIPSPGKTAIEYVPKLAPLFLEKKHFYPQYAVQGGKHCFLVLSIVLYVAVLAKIARFPQACLRGAYSLVLLIYYGCPIVRRINMC